MDIRNYHVAVASGDATLTRAIRRLVPDVRNGRVRDRNARRRSSSATRPGMFTTVGKLAGAFATLPERDREDLLGRLAGRAVYDRDHQFVEWVLGEVPAPDGPEWLDVPGRADLLVELLDGAPDDDEREALVRLVLDGPRIDPRSELAGRLGRHPEVLARVQGVDPAWADEYADPERVRAWADAGLGPADHRELSWLRDAARDLADETAAAVVAKRAGWPRQRISRIANQTRRFLPLAAALEAFGELSDAGVGVNDAIGWLGAGVTDADGVARWAAAGFDPGSAARWSFAGVDPDDAAAWQDRDEAFRDAVVFARAGIAPGDVERDWHGMPLADACAWVQAEIPAGHARTLAAAGIEPYVASGVLRDVDAPLDRAVPLLAAAHGHLPGGRGLAEVVRAAVAGDVGPDMLEASLAMAGPRTGDDVAAVADALRATRLVAA